MFHCRFFFGSLAHPIALNHIDAQLHGVAEGLEWHMVRRSTKGDSYTSMACADEGAKQSKNHKSFTCLVLYIGRILCPLHYNVATQKDSFN